MFEDILGNKANKEYLEEAILKNRVSHSYIFSGKSGIGKKLIAKEFANNILCKTEEDKVKFEAGSHPDFKIIIPDGTSIKINQIRELQMKISEKPVLANKKIYIIDDANLMTEESQNCFLKTLEEPPEYAIIILIVNSESSLLTTVKSRCVILKFNELSNEEIKSKYGNLDNDTLDLLDGSLEKIDTIEDTKEILKALKDFADALKNKPLEECFLLADVLYSNKDKAIELLEYLEHIFFEKKEYDAIDIIEKTKKKITSYNNYEMSIDNLILNIHK